MRPSCWDRGLDGRLSMYRTVLSSDGTHVRLGMRFEQKLSRVQRPTHGSFGESASFGELSER